MLQAWEDDAAISIIGNIVKCLKALLTKIVKSIPVLYVDFSGDPIQ